MTSPLILLAWTVGGALAFGLLGGLFGGVVGWLNVRGGHAAGSAMGRRVADALARLSESELSEQLRGTLIGAVDGALFLGGLGTLVGLAAAQTGRAPEAWLVPLFRIVAALVGGALMFGLLATGIVKLRLRAVLGIFVGGIACALLTASHFGAQHIVPGAVAGIVVGLLLTMVLPR